MSKDSYITEIRSGFISEQTGSWVDRSEDDLTMFRERAQETVTLADQVYNLNGLLRAFLKTRRGRVAEYEVELLNVMHERLAQLYDGMLWLDSRLAEAQWPPSQIAMEDPTGKRSELSLVPARPSA